MPSPYSVCLLGFSDFERRALAMQFGLAAARNPSYTLVATPQEARFLVVDADAKSALQRALDAGRLADTLFVGAGTAPAGALARLKRPIDAVQHVLKHLRMGTRQIRRLDLQRGQTGRLARETNRLTARFPRCHRRFWPKWSAPHDRASTSS